MLLDVLSKLPNLGDLGGMIVIGFAAPVLLGLVTSLGDWKAVLISCLIWYGGMLLATILAGIDRSQAVLTFAFVYGFLFSIIVIPTLSFAVMCIRSLVY